LYDENFFNSTKLSLACSNVIFIVDTFQWKFNLRESVCSTVCLAFRVFSEMNTCVQTHTIPSSCCHNLRRTLYIYIYIYIYIYGACFVWICALTFNQYSVYKGMRIRTHTINSLVTLLIDYTSLAIFFEIKTCYGPNCAIYSVISIFCSSHIMVFVVWQCMLTTNFYL